MANFKEEFEKMMDVTEYCLSVGDTDGKINETIEDAFSEAMKSERFSEIMKTLDTWFED